MTSRCIVLLLLLAASAAADPLKDAYHHARRIRDPAKRKAYAASQAPALAGQASGVSHLYLGYLWKYAEEWDKAAASFRSYVAQADTGSKNRAIAMLEGVLVLVEARRWSDVPGAGEEYLRANPAGRHRGRVLFSMGRAQRMLGELEAALESFRKAAMARDEASAYERLDCLAQLGRYEELVRQAAAAADKGGRFATLAKAAGQLGKKLPKLDFDNWTGKDLALSEVFDRPVLFVFWTTKAVGRARDLTHELGNAWAKKYGDKVRVAGPTLYYRFDPTRMASDENLAPQEEWRFIEGWHDEYKLAYPLCTLNDPALHDACGVDPQRPVLPAVAVVDRKMRLRYVRVIDGPWAREAVEAMVARVLKE